MSSILDSMMTKPQGFVPENVDEYTALQLARKLGDTDQVSKYRSLLDRHALPVIVEAFINAQQARLPTSEVTAAVAFEEELMALTKKEHQDEF